jgi:hypothetical protein
LGDEKGYKKAQSVSQSVTQSPQFYVQPTAISAEPPPVVRCLFEVNSEPHTGARPSFRLCVGLINMHREATRNHHINLGGGLKDEKNIFYFPNILSKKYFFLSTLLNSNKKTLV